jgi:hypothetical protein
MTTHRCHILLGRHDAIHLAVLSTGRRTAQSTRRSTVPSAAPSTTAPGVKPDTATSDAAAPDGGRAVGLTDGRWRSCPPHAPSCSPPPTTATSTP